MNLLTLILYIAIAAAVFTGLSALMKGKHKSWVMTFLQHFTGILFIVSGLVKAIDPMGTAYKMEQYFTEFQYTFADTSFSFLAGLFPFLSSISLVFSIVMIVFEMVLGLMLILGYRAKLTSWLFLLLVLFFTMLTGFTFLTGYVPSGTNFFSFSSWGPYTASNMRVTDCGCFGDFIKLVPRISFYKDLVLLVPAFYFVFRHRDMHQLFTPRVRNILVGAATILSLLFCLYNSIWNLPVVDFRPFSVGTDLYQKKTAEEEAAAAVKVISMKLRNKASGEVKEVSYEDYMKNWAQYPKEEWETIEQIKSKITIEPTKVSEFSIMSPDGFDVAEDILTDSGDVFLVVAYTLKGESAQEEITVQDTVWQTDTIFIVPDSMVVVKSVDTVVTKKITTEVYHWNPNYTRLYTQKVNPFLASAMEQGAKVYAAAGGAGSEKLNSFRQAIAGDYEWYEADDILLKTIIRSNPGIVHIKAGKVVDMWHIRHLPATIQLQ